MYAVYLRFRVSERCELRLEFRSLSVAAEPKFEIRSQPTTTVFSSQSVHRCGVVVNGTFLLRFDFPGTFDVVFGLLPSWCSSAVGPLFEKTNMSNNDCRIYVGNLPPDIRTKDIQDLFYKFGKVLFVDLKNQRGPPFAFVEFDDPRWFFQLFSLMICSSVNLTNKRLRKLDVECNLYIIIYQCPIPSKTTAQLRFGGPDEKFNLGP